MAIADAPRVHIETIEQWRDWLAAHAGAESAVWAVTWRRPTDRPAPSYEDQVIEALRVGWIDSTRKRIDDERTMLYFARRRPGSIWARSNRDRVARLEAEGRMLPAGQAIVDRARADGSWSMLQEVEDLIVPADLAQALHAHRARDRWDGLAPSVREQALWWIVSAKRPATRAKRVEETASRAALGEGIS